MSGNLLHKYGATKPEQRGSEASLEEPEDFDDHGAFGFLRGVRDRALMLELRHRDGRVTALAYAWLESAHLDPSDGITLFFGDKTIRITGRNLNAELRANVCLFSAIVRHRAPWIQETDGPTALVAPQNAIVVEEIVIE